MKTRRDETHKSDCRKRTWAEIDLDALLHNYNLIKDKSGCQRVMAVVKADAYGHGAVTLSKFLEKAGADWFGVSNIEEAVQLRHAGITHPILVLGYTPPTEAFRLRRENIAQAVFSVSYAKHLSKCAADAGCHIDIHIKLDTGMARIGFDCRSDGQTGSAADQIAECCRLPGLTMQGIFTHFASSDGDGDDEIFSFTSSQYERLLKTAEELRRRGIDPGLIHCSNSAGILNHPDKSLDMVRAGIILYGLSPGGEVAYIDELKPEMSFRTVVCMVKELIEGDGVSYGLTYKAARKLKAASIAVGYADGYPRSLSNRGRVLIHGCYAPVIGRVCMDQMVVDVTDIPNVKEGDTVTIFGKDGNNSIPVGELAAQTGTINHEIICNISKRVPRIFIKDGEIVAVENHISDHTD